MPESFDHDATDLEQLLDQLDSAVDSPHREITVEEIVTAVGTRSFAPLLLLVGLLIASPLSGIPVFPSITALIVILISLQLLAGRRHFWLPSWLLIRSVPRNKIASSIKWLRPPARFIDRFIKPRLTFLVKGPAMRIIAVLCLLMAAGMPLLEFIPFSSSLAGAALAAFGLSLVSGDGLLGLIAYSAAAATFGVVLYGVVI